MSYSKDEDYKKKMNDAAGRGDYASAAVYERQRNEKIRGEGLGYEQTNQYGSYLPDTGTIDAIERFQNVPDQSSGARTGQAAQAATQAGGNSVRLPSYGGQYTQPVEDLLSEIAGSKFSYNYENDPLYQQYAKSYEAGGQRAMQDTLAQVSARTGGLASSYAGAAAQQANERYMQGLSDKIPELSQLAYSMYLGELDKKQRLLSNYLNLDEMGYNRFAGDRNFAYQYGRDLLGDARYDTEYGDSRGDVAYGRQEQMAANLAAGGDFSGYKALGYSDAQIKNMHDAYQRQTQTQTSVRSGGGGYGGGQKSGGDTDYDGLYAAAWASPNADNYISSHYKDFGFTSVSGLKDGFQQWRDTPVDNGQSINKTSIDVMTKNVGKMLSVGRSPEYIYDALKKQGFADAVIDRIFAAAGL